MGDSLEVGSLSARLELDDDEFGSKLDDDKEKMQDFGDTADDKLSVAIKVDDSEASKIDDTKSKLEDLQGAGDNSLELRANTSEADSALEGVQESLGSIQSMMETVGEIALFAAAIEGAEQLVGAIDQCIEAYGEMRYAATSAGLKAGGGAGATQQIMDVAGQIGPQVGKSPEEIAGVMSTIMGYGQPLGSISAQSLMPYMNLATLPNVGMQDAAKLLALTKNNFGLEEGPASDMYAKALESSNLSASALSSAMPKMLLASKQANIPLDEMLSMMTAENQSKGADATQTAMALFTGANKLTAPLDPMTMNAKGKMAGGSGIAKELQEEGVSLDTINNKSDSFLQKLVNLDQAGADFGKIFGAKQGDLLHDIADNAQGIENFSNILDNSQGAAQRYADTMRDTLPEAEKRFGVSVDELKEQIGSKFEPLKMDALKAGQEFVEALSQGIESGDFTGAIDALANLKSIVQKDVEGFFDNIDYTSMGWKLYSGLQSIWDDFIQPALEWRGDQTGINQALKSMLEPSFRSLKLTATRELLEIQDQFAPLTATAVTDFQLIQSAGIDAFNAIIAVAANMAASVVESVGLAVGESVRQLGNLGSALNPATYGNVTGATSPQMAYSNFLNDLDKGVDPVTAATTYVNAAYPNADPANKQQMIKNSVAAQQSGALYEPITGSGSGKTSYGGVTGTPISSSGGGSSTPKTGITVGFPGSGGTSDIGTPGMPYQGSGTTNSFEVPLLSVKSLGGVHLEAESLTNQLEKHSVLYEMQNSGIKVQTTETQANTGALGAVTGALSDLPSSLSSWADQIESSTKGIADNIRNGATAAQITNPNQGKSYDELYKQNLADIRGSNKAEWDAYYKELVDFWLDQNIAAIDPLKDGIFQTSGVLDELDAHVISLGDSVQRASSGMDDSVASNAKYEASMNWLAGKNGEYGCVMSEFGTWQEDSADALFNQGYVGPSGANYDAFLQEEAARGAIHPGVNKLGYDYANPNKPATIQLGIDYTEADAGVTTVQGKAGTKQTMPLSLDSGAAVASLEAVSDSAQTEKKMPIRAGGC